MCFFVRMFNLPQLKESSKLIILKLNGEKIISLYFHVTHNDRNLLMLECEDDLNGASVETPNTGTEAHELVEIRHPLGTR